MFSKFSKEQLENLVFHTTGINTILLDALLLSPEEPEDGELEVELEIHVVEIGHKSKPQK